jgi:transposase-like protein
MGRPPSIPAEKKTRIVLSVLAGEMSIAEAARKEKVSEQSIGRWKTEFLEPGMSTARVCQLFDMPERTWRRWQAKARTGA